MPRKDTIASREEEREFMQSFLERADDANEEYRTIDREVLENYMVLPPGQGNWGNRVAYHHGRSVLADPETHQMVETLLAKLMLGSMSDHGYVTATPVGAEDWHSSEIANRLLERSFRQRGNRRAMYTALKNMVIFGMGVVVPSWRFEEGMRTRRVVEVDPFTGEEFSYPVMVPSTTWDDVWFESLSPEDVFADPGHDQIENMMGFAHRIFVAEHEALDMVERGRWDKESVDNAIANTRKTGGRSRTHSSEPLDERDDDYREGIDRLQHREMPPAYNPMIGYQGWFRVPYRTQDGSVWRRLTMLNHELVESRAIAEAGPISRNIPAYEFIINPVDGRLRGVAPGAVARFTQSFTNALLMSTADAVVKKVRAPVVYDRTAGIDAEKLHAWAGPIAARNINGVKELRYDVALGEAFALLEGSKAMMRQGSGALESLQGIAPAKTHISATAERLRFENATDRPSMMQLLLEDEYLPSFGQGVFELNQAFIEDSQDLSNRVGASALRGRPVFLEQIQADFDIRFVGTSRGPNRELKLQLLERAWQVAGSIPGAAANFPWADSFVYWLDLAGMKRLEAMVGDPNTAANFLQNVSAQQGGGQNPTSVNNGAGRALTAAGLEPAQAAGQAL